MTIRIHGILFEVERPLGETYDGLAWLFLIREVMTGREHLLYLPKAPKAWWAYRLLLLDEVT